jgi:hypothetical protein
MLCITEHRGAALPSEGTPEQDFRDILRRRLPLLAEEDRALMGLYLDSGHSLRQLARLAGTSPSTVARRIHRITHRLADPTYFVCLQSRSVFSDLELAIIRDYFVRGCSYLRISRCRSLTTYRVRTIVLKAKKLANFERH